MKKIVIALIDSMGIPLTIFCLKWLRFLRKIGLERMPHSRKQLIQVGVLPVTDHYFEPLFHHNQLNRPLNFSRELSGIDWNNQRQLDLLKNFRYQQELLAIPWSQIKPHAFSYDNNSYRAGDAESLYCMIRHFKPARLYEIGSGNSTLMARLAIEKNKSENPSYTCHHVCIEPYEQPWLEQSGVVVVRKTLEQMDLNLFKELQQNDILFIDSSHVIRPQGDVVIEYLEILPALKPGVFVHVHDIFTPEDYPADWIFKNYRLWNEQYLLEGFLTCNHRFDIVLALNYLKLQFPNELKEVFPVFGQKFQETFPGAFWMQSKS